MVTKQLKQQNSKQHQHKKQQNETKSKANKEGKTQQINKAKQ